MLQQDHWQTHPSHAEMPGGNKAPNMRADDSSTFVNPLHEGASQSFSPYAYSPETAMPPPPPGIDAPFVPQSKRSIGYLIALVVLSVLVVALGSLELLLLTTITSITVDTTNLRTIWTIRLKNESGDQQIDYFAEFGLQDPCGNTYEGTGNLHTDYFLDAGQTAMEIEIFSFLPRPGVSYTLVARLGISGITYDPLQVTF